MGRHNAIIQELKRRHDCIGKQMVRINKGFFINPRLLNLTSRNAWFTGADLSQLGVWRIARIFLRFSGALNEQN